MRTVKKQKSKRNKNEVTMLREKNRKSLCQVADFQGKNLEFCEEIVMRKNSLIYENNVIIL